MSSSLPQLDAKTHTLNCVFGGVELEKVLPPLQFTFQEHLLQDEAALVHTKKVNSVNYILPVTCLYATSPKVLPASDEYSCNYKSYSVTVLCKILLWENIINFPSITVTVISPKLWL